MRPKTSPLLALSVAGLRPAEISEGFEDASACLWKLTVHYSCKRGEDVCFIVVTERRGVKTKIILSMSRVFNFANEHRIQTSVGFFRYGLFRSTLLLATVLVTVLTCWVGSSHSSWAQGDKTSPSVSLLGDPLKLKLEKQETPVRVTIFNNSSQPTDLTKFSAVLRDSKGNSPKKEVNITPTDPIQVEPYSVTPVDLSIDKSQFTDLSMPLRGFLVASGVQRVSGEEVPVASGTLPITLSEPKVLPASLSNFLPFSPQAWIILFPCIIAIAWVAVSSRGPIKNTRLSLLSRLGTTLTPSLKFGTGGSWASTVAVVAAILGVFTTATVFPEERAYFSKEEIGGFTLFFGVLVIFAPVIYNLIRGKQPVVVVSKDNPSDIMGEPQVQGYVCTLLTASTLILAALLGQLAIAALLILQVETAMAPVAKWLLGTMIIVSAIYVLGYSWSSIRSTLEEKAEKMEQLEQTQETRQEKLRQMSQQELGDLPQDAEAYYTHEHNLPML